MRRSLEDIFGRSATGWALMLVLVVVIALAVIFAEPAKPASTTTPTLPPASLGKVLALTVRFNQPDPKFKGQIVDIIAVTIRNTGRLEHIRSTLYAYIGKEVDAVPAVIVTKPAVRFSGFKADFSWTLALAPKRTTTVRFFVRHTGDKRYCAGGTPNRPDKCTT